MRFYCILLVISAVILIFPVKGNAQDAGEVQDTTAQEKKVPEALRKFVKEYKQKVEKDSSIKQEKSLMERNALSSIVMDNTLSKLGHDFYKYFYEQWDPPETDRNFTIYINEKPAPGIGNLVEIKINYDKIFRSRLTPRQQAIKRIATRAVKKSTNYLANYEKIKQQLEGEDMKGTGIY